MPRSMRRYFRRSAARLRWFGSFSCESPFLGGLVSGCSTGTPRRPETPVMRCEKLLAAALPKRSERGSELGAKQLRLFPGREVAAFVDLVEVGQVAIGAPRPGLRGPVDLLRKHADGDRQRNVGGLLCGRDQNALAGGLPVEPRG